MASIIVITLISINISSGVIEGQVKENTLLLSESYSQQLNNKVRKLKNSSVDLASAIVTAVNVETVLKDAIKRYPEINSIYYTSYNGDVLDMAPFNQDYINLNFEDVKDWKNAIENQTSVISSLNNILGEKSFFIYTPVLINYVESLDPQVVGVVVFSVSAEYIFSDIKNVEYGDNGSLIVINSDGYYLYNENDDLEMKERFSQMSESVNVTDLSGIEKLMIDQSAGIGTFYKGLDKHFVSFAPVYEANWSLAIIGPYSEFTSSINPIIFINGIILFATIISSSILIFFIVKGVSKPLIELTDATKKIAEGDLSFRTTIISNNEVGQLSKAFNIMVNKVENFNKSLEKEVILRTEDLTVANEELITMNESIESMNKKLIASNSSLDEKAQEIEAMNEELTASNSSLESLNGKLISTVEELEATQKALWSEMELAHKIQTVLLPDEPVIEGFDIGVIMKTNESVGGDYYDVINVGGYNWFTIGDVSGHGVTAGLIMMMVQTSIHIVLSQNPNIDPKDLIYIINKTIHNNIVKLGSDKYVTLTVFACKDNKVLFSGAHLPIFIYREKDQLIEKIETKGVWIGLVDNIEGLNKTDEFELESGDIILLYTDGITEALTDDGKNFTQNGLLDLFKVNSDKSPKDICENIMNYTNNLSVDDDITIMALKKV